MDINELITAVLLRILNDHDTDETDLGNLLTEFKAIKGPRKPANWDECLTIHILSNPQDPDFKNHNGTLIINYFCPNYETGNANVEKMGPVAARLVKLFDDKPLILVNYNNYNLVVLSVEGPLFDPAEPDEHFMSVRIRFNLI